MHSCRDNLHERVCETQCMFLKSELSQAESLWMSHHAVGWHIGTDVLDVTPHCRVAYRDRCALRYGVRAAAGLSQHRRSQDGQAPRGVYFSLIRRVDEEKGFTRTAPSTVTLSLFDGCHREGIERCMVCRPRVERLC